MKPNSAALNSKPHVAFARVLVVGLGGLGCPLLLALKDQPQLSFVLCDEDTVDETNLHRQILFSEADLGKDKAQCVKRWLQAQGVSPDRIELHGRLLPDNARTLVRSVDLVVEGADNFATKFLAADAAYLEAKPIVHGAAVGWQTTVWSVAPEGRPCYRCLFEAVPTSPAPNCDSIGVIGPVAGFGAALMAELALACLAGRAKHARIYSYEGRSDRFREVSVPARPSCPLCGTRSLLEISPRNYEPTAPLCGNDTLQTPAPDLHG